MTGSITKLNNSAMYKQPKHYAWAYLRCVQ